MGRYSGFIAVYTAIGAACEIACVPESITDIDAIVEHIHVLKKRNKTSVMMIVAEGDEEGGAEVLNERIKAKGCPFPTRVVILGHLQRGGSPTPEDRILASRLGDFAVRAALDGATGVMAGILGPDCTLTQLEDTYHSHKPIPPELFDLLQTLSS